MDAQDVISKCYQKVMSGERISEREAGMLFDLPDECLGDLARAADLITQKFNGAEIDVEQLNNIKKNACSEDCAFCGQSAFFDTGIPTYDLPLPEEVVAKARQAEADGAGSYCLVAAWREPSARDFEKVCKIVSAVRASVQIDIECSLGFLTPEQAATLKRLGVSRYNHNLETARSKFPQICTTHTYDDRLRTLKVARRAGLELCTGGIIGLGESRAQRLELALDLAGLGPEEVAINMLMPVPGTPMELQADIGVREIARMFSVMRFLLPTSTIKVSGGREQRLADSGEELLRSGANGIITGGYLTTPGNRPSVDAGMIRRIEAKAKP